MSGAQRPSKVEQEDPPTTESNDRNGDRGLDGRLRNVEIQLAEIRTKLDTQLDHLATKNEVTKLKVWVLTGVLGGMAIAAGITLGIARLAALPEVTQQATVPSIRGTRADDAPAPAGAFHAPRKDLDDALRTPAANHSAAPSLH